MPALALALLLAAAEARTCPKRPGEVAGAPLSIENRSGQSIYNLYAAPKGRGWGCDRLDDFTIPRGGSRQVALFHPRGRCDYRLRLILADRSERVRRVDLCRGGKWVISAEGESFEADPPSP